MVLLLSCLRAAQSPSALVFLSLENLLQLQPSVSLHA